jgi:hypothetical protein
VIECISWLHKDMKIERCHTLHGSNIEVVSIVYHISFSRDIWSDRLKDKPTVFSCFTHVQLTASILLRHWPIIDIEVLATIHMSQLYRHSICNLLAHSVQLLIFIIFILYDFFVLVNSDIFIYSLDLWFKFTQFHFILLVIISTVFLSESS